MRTISPWASPLSQCPQSALGDDAADEEEWLVGDVPAVAEEATRRAGALTAGGAARAADDDEEEGEPPAPEGKCGPMTKVDEAPRCAGVTGIGVLACWGMGCVTPWTSMRASSWLQ